MESEIGHHVVSYYRKLFAKDGLLNTNFEFLHNFTWPHVSQDQNLILTATPSPKEVRDTVFSLDPASSPGPDGFGGYFYQKCWEVISEDVTNTITHLFASLEFPAGMNSSLVTLIPKVANSIRVTDFRPIVMENFSYKIFTKIVATWLGGFIGEVLSPSQYIFVPGRNIHTCIALDSETIKSLQMGKNDNMAI